MRQITVTNLPFYFSTDNAYVVPSSVSFLHSAKLLQILFNILKLYLFYWIDVLLNINYVKCWHIYKISLPLLVLLFHCASLCVSSNLNAFLRMIKLVMSSTFYINMVIQFAAISASRDVVK